MNKMRCEEANSLLPLYIENMLSEEETEQISAHLESCASCREACELQRAIMREMQALPAVAPSAEFSARLHEGLCASVGASMGKKRPSWRKYLAPTLATAAVVAVTAASLSVVPNLQKWKQADLPEPTATAMPSETEMPAQTEAPATAAPTKRPQPTEAPAQQALTSAVPEKQVKQAAKAEARAEKTVAPTAVPTETPVTAEKTFGAVEDAAEENHAALGDTLRISKSMMQEERRTKKTWVISVSGKAMAAARHILSDAEQTGGAYRVWDFELEAYRAAFAALNGYSGEKFSEEEVTEEYRRLSETERRSAAQEARLAELEEMPYHSYIVLKEADSLE